MAEQQVQAAAPGLMRSGERQSVEVLVVPADPGGIDIENVEAGHGTGGNANKRPAIRDRTKRCVQKPSLRERPFVVTATREYRQ
jgi:hypothetical protein